MHGWYIYTMEYYSAIKKEWNNAICSNMDGPRDYHTKWSKSERERQIPYDITYMWNLKYDTNGWWEILFLGQGIHSADKNLFFLIPKYWLCPTAYIFHPHFLISKTSSEFFLRLFLVWWKRVSLTQRPSRGHLWPQFMLVKEDLEKEDTCGIWAMTSVWTKLSDPSNSY